MSHKTTLFPALVDTVKELRGDKGCPWDKRQTAETLTKYLQSELNELLIAIDNGDTDNLCEELGDLLYLIVMVSQINSECGFFSIDDVIAGINSKLIRRHPHVFENQIHLSDEELRQQWQRIKAEEKGSK